ncbi:helix-turn-helix transcriptional regulator [Miniphocaeibacter massiliensis]|uniref:helix-turn-helix transcriptional regulator n=1 Tax=Miniphocaeibacter massiliensis TaxID=2041841 RepID=UPI000C1B871C|nr:response regulator transcription factor [Miniphocaeibacter massiliensis]
MYEWQKQIQTIVDEIDKCIKNYNSEDLTLKSLSNSLGYSEFYMTRKFKEIAGIQFRDYLRYRKLGFALKEIRDTDRNIVNIAFDYGFSSHEAFTRAFKKAYGITPTEYRKNPKPVVLRTKISPFDRYFLGLGEIGMIKSTEDIKTYFITIPAHKFLHIKNYESNGYWDFWEKQSVIEGQDCDTICGLLDSIKGKLDDDEGSESDASSGQVMAYINDSKGRLCDWGFLRTECYGVRLPIDYNGEIPPQMQMIDIPEGEYIVFEHGRFDYEQEHRSLEEKIEKAMSEFSFEDTGYSYDKEEGRIMYFHFDPERYWKYIRPVKRVE